MDNMEMRKHLLENIAKMLNWINEQFKNADCDVPFSFKFERGFEYNHFDCDYLEFSCSRDSKFVFHHYRNYEYVKDGQLYDNEGNCYTESYLSNPNWYIPKENENGFRKAMDKWPSVKAAVLEHLESMKRISDFEV